MQHQDVKTFAKKMGFEDVAKGNDIVTVARTRQDVLNWSKGQLRETYKSMLGVIVKDRVVHKDVLNWLVLLEVDYHSKGDSPVAVAEAKQKLQTELQNGIQLLDQSQRKDAPVSARRVAFHEREAPNRSRRVASTPRGECATGVSHAAHTECCW